MTQQWDFPVDEPVLLPAWRAHKSAEQLPTIAARIAAGATLRGLAAEYGVSHEALRQTLKRAGIATGRPATPAPPPRRSRSYRVAGLGRSRVFAPSEVAVLLARHSGGESIRALARATGVSHETLRRLFAAAPCTVDHGMTA
jgi:lambda repressor-like predicted transcriptional regulator